MILSVAFFYYVFLASVINELSYLTLLINFLKNHTKYWYIFFKRYIIKENVFFCDSTLFLEN